MKKLTPTLRYLLRGFTVLTVIAFLSVLGNIAITNLIFHWTAQSSSTQAVVTLTAPIEGTAGVFALLTGLILIIINFRVAVANGVSRKTFLLASLPAAALMAAALAVFNGLVLVVHRLFWPVIMSSQLIFPNSGLLALMLMNFAIYLMLVNAGWFISLAYYRSNVPGRWAISLAPVALILLLIPLNAETGGVLFRVFRDFWLLTMRTSPILATVTMLAYAAILYGLVYLLIRRAPVS